ncbi:putative Zn-dependent protease-like protein [Desulfitobacterium dichloroeliminans LMG P-21439]|uniref:Putative Zn-dependent protease-like protein n=1 Tax=Desulfitobacterium dichloroeliminans (strain LMG P-21439 / DCA1) TaxID=871963 RepID=L0FB40_DESDL|nr:TldD/PmbA family protein [Desulfitobacterium dichloroeliminans]AGA70240.1 putative Zn-dependent protease-like protein [Desulfitobacterium dichloroeliminans LMG P-21439]
MKRKEIAEIVQSILQVEGLKTEDGCYYVVRAQFRREWSLKLTNGRFERVSTASESGIGIQAFTPEGASGFASVDTLTVEAGREAMKRALSLAQHNARIGAELNQEIFRLSPLQAEGDNPAKLEFDHFSLEDLQEQVVFLHKRLVDKGSETSWQSNYRQVEDIWCIGRTDGTLVSYTVPRAVLMHQGTVREQGRAKNVLVQRSGVDANLLLVEKEDASLEQKAVERAEFARRVCIAPSLPSGHYPLIIDYGLAKGLAHEAFGHAVESDHMKESVLGENGKFKKGLQVARKGVHIIDGPLVGDWAYQPYSANGLVREMVEIVKDGVLEAGLGDVFSAREAGMPITGAGRAESYGSIPLPRMTNIRLLVDYELALPNTAGLMDEVSQVRKVLLEEGELQQEGKHLLLLGYRGGQVNPKTGDFVFQCDGIIDVADSDLTIYQPSIFSGKILSALQAIRAGLGGGCYDAIGTCGKGGQSVPSSGGSHRYLLLDQDENVNLGGE